MIKFGDKDITQIWLGHTDDAARYNLGGSWRIPTKDEWESLVAACTLTWQSNYNNTGKTGYLLTLNTDTTKKLFFPAGGYWASTAASQNYTTPYAYGCNMNSTKNGAVQGYLRFDGVMVRAVSSDLSASGVTINNLVWATDNVTNNAIFAYGEVKPKSTYTLDTYSTDLIAKYASGTTLELGRKISKVYKGDVLIWPIITDIDDAANFILGESYRMPTIEEWEELKNNCTWTWMTLDGINGFKVANKTDSNKWIFLPAGGYFEHDTSSADGFNFDLWYWAANRTSENDIEACTLWAYNNYKSTQAKMNRANGLKIRPVSDIQTLKCVDLGVSTYWAKFNLISTGFAAELYNSGDFFSWGETEPKTSFSWSNYKYGTNTNITKYNNTDGLMVLTNAL